MTFPGWWNKRWIHVLAAATLVTYLVLRALIFWDGIQIRHTQAKLDEMRPRVVKSMQAKEYQSLLKAHQQFIDSLRASTVDWQEKMQKLSQILPPSMVLNTLIIQDSKMTLQGVLRHPPTEPQEYLVGVSNALKQEGVFKEVVVAVTPPDIDDPSMVRVELTGKVS